jgi:lipopolysaccharide/colanic/teichoic acid biosynthesis glycosyltransferase
VKRAIDLILSVPGLIVLAPLLAALALLIKLDSPGPLFATRQLVRCFAALFGPLLILIPGVHWRGRRKEGA